MSDQPPGKRPEEPHRPDPDDRKALVAEAADIFVGLRNAPDDAAMLARREAFRARGPAERAVYAQVERTWESAGRSPRPGRAPGKGLIIAALCMLAATAWFLAGPLRPLLIADVSTQLAPDRVVLTSGDRATLDADSALADWTGGPERTLRLLDGAALFEVESDGRPFVVRAGALEVAVLGTTFEVARMGAAISVAVAEGTVRVRAGGSDWTLEAGERLDWSEEAGARRVRVAPGAVAPWRQGRFLADGLTFAQVAEVIDRRLPGGVLVVGADLAGTRVSGTIDLGAPDRALRALAATRGARILEVPFLGRLILP